MIQTMPKFLRVLLFMNIASILLPVAMQYVSATLLLIWIIVNKLFLRPKLVKDFLYPNDRSQFFDIGKILLVLFVLNACVCIAGSASSSFDSSWGDILSDAWHLSAKQSFLPMALGYGIYLLRGLYVKDVSFAKSICIYVSIYLVYCILQRQFGLDWVRGFEAVLPQNRHAYGVYRISGFMGHPLSLAYNLVFAIILFTFLGVGEQLKGQKKLAFWWFFAAIQAFVILALSGSRWPLLVMLLVAGIWAFKRLLKYWKAAILALALGCGLLYLEGSMVGRVQEVFEGGKLNPDRFQRLVFWKIHWKMFSDQPVLGVGYSARQVAAVDYYNNNGYNSIERKFSAHNQYLQILADSGLVGILLFLAFWIWLVLKFRMFSDPFTKKILMTLVMVVTLSCLMKNVMRDTEFVFGFWLCVAVVLAELPRKQTVDQEWKKVNNQS